MRKIVARCLIVAGLSVVVLGFWMSVQGSEDQGTAQAEMYGQSSAALGDLLGNQSGSSETAAMADAQVQQQRGQMLSTIGSGALFVGAGGLILGIVLALRSPGKKIATMEPAIVQSSPTQTPPGVADRKPCPYCGESISVLAHVCRFCQHDLDSDSV